MKQRIESPITESVDFVLDVAKLLQSVGIVQICYQSLDNAIHSKMKAQTLVNHAESLFKKRKKQGVITFEALLSTLN